MDTFLRNTISKLYDAVTAPVASTRDALAEKLQSVRDTAYLLNQRPERNWDMDRHWKILWKLKQKNESKSSSKMMMNNMI